MAIMLGRLRMDVHECIVAYKYVLTVASGTDEISSDDDPFDKLQNLLVLWKKIEDSGESPHNSFEGESEGGCKT